MSRRRKRYTIENLRVEGMAAEGKCIARHNEKVVFIPHVAPGDLIDAFVTKEKKAFIEAKPVKFHELSPDRAEPACEHFGTCGGCKWQHISYENQLKYKQQQVKDNFERIGHLPTDTLVDIKGSEEKYFYRNKLEFTAAHKRWLTEEEIAEGSEDIEKRGLGFHMPGSYDRILDIEHCSLQTELSNKIRLFIREQAFDLGMTFYNIREHHGMLRNIIVRTAESGELMLVVQFGEKSDLNKELLERLKNKFPEITSLLYVLNLKMNDTIGDQKISCYHGKDHMVEHMPLDIDSEKVLQFKIGPKSFYQTNAKQAFQLYKITRDLADIQPDDVVYDLYTGTGTIANFVAHQAKKVVGVEYVESAIEDARINSNLNNIDNTVFYAGDMKDIFTTEFINENGHPDVMIIDPPRAGMHENVVNTVLETAPKKIVYVSCNPATQARDLQLMHDKYKIDKIYPVDMFPQTHHVENIVRLDLRDKKL